MTSNFPCSAAFRTLGRGRTWCFFYPYRCVVSTRLATPHLSGFAQIMYVLRVNAPAFFTWFPWGCFMNNTPLVQFFLSFYDLNFIHKRLSFLFLIQFYLYLSHLYFFSFYVHSSTFTAFLNFRAQLLKHQTLLDGCSI
jgi:hypothetical protein